jgi:predicted nucleic acid-binding protein
MIRVVDASVVVKWFIPERDHEAALRLRDDFLDGEVDLTAPALLPFEVVNALRYSGHYEGDALAQAAESLGDYGLELRPFADCGAVAAVTGELDISVYDASYLALAAAVAGRVLTADELLLGAAEDGGYADLIDHIGAYG